MGILALFGKKNAQERDFNPDYIVGKRALVTEDVNNQAGCGQVKVNGQLWAARSVNDENIYAVGESVSIVAVEGVRLVCTKN